MLFAVAAITVTTIKKESEVKHSKDVSVKMNASQESSIDKSNVGTWD